MATASRKLQCKKELANYGFTVQLNNVGDPIASQTEENVYRTHGHSVNREMIASSLAARNLCRIVDLDRVAGE